MPIAKAVITTWSDSVNPTDGIQITPHFIVTDLIGTAMDKLAADLMTAWTAYIQTGYRTSQRRVTIYNAQGNAPNYPISQVEANTGAATAATVNRDIAGVLSFYAAFNRPRYRGRLYLPLFITGSAISGPTMSTTTRDKIGSLAGILAGIPDTTWAVYSRVDNVARNISNWWVDDSFDSQRRRGARATARTLGTTPQ
jgi:hypothetical protein